MTDNCQSRQAMVDANGVLDFPAFAIPNLAPSVSRSPVLSDLSPNQLVDQWYGHAGPHRVVASFLQVPRSCTACVLSYWQVRKCFGRRRDGHQGAECEHWMLPKDRLDNRDKGTCPILESKIRLQCFHRFVLHIKSASSLQYHHGYTCMYAIHHVLKACVLCEKRNLAQNRN